MLRRIAARCARVTLLGVGEFVSLRCEAEVLRGIGASLARFGPADGQPGWLVSAVWLCAADAYYLATASAQVLANGYVARPLNIHRASELMREIRADLPNVMERLIGRNGDLDSVGSGEAPEPPSALAPWPAGPYSTEVLVRVSERHTATNRIACALLFERADGSLLVGTDPSTLAMVLSSDPALIERYRADCEALSPDEYLDRCTG